MRHWFGVARKYYNAAIELMTAVENRHLGTALANIRPIIFDRLNELDYCKEVPEKIRQGAVADACKAVSNAKSKFAKTGRFQHCKYRTKKQLSQSVYIIDTAVSEVETGKGLTIHERVSHMGKLKTSEILPKSPATSYRLTMECNKFFYLCVPVDLEDLSHRQGTEGDIVALDPGSRSFQVFYSQDVCGIVQQNTAKMRRLQKETDLLRAKMDKFKNQVGSPGVTSKFKGYLRGRIARLRAHFLTLNSRQTRVVTEMHRGIANFLLRRFDTILLPNFETARLKLLETTQSTTNRSYDTYAHYRFKEYLHFKAREYKRNVFAVSEVCTTKTCSRCGYLKHDVGRSEVYECDSCGLRADRDMNAAKNILVRNIVECC